MFNERQISPADVRTGDWISADTPGSRALRRGQITEMLGSPRHRHYRVRWDEKHESIFFPADGTRITRLDGEDS